MHLLKKGEWIGTLSKTFGTAGQMVLKHDPDLIETLQKTELVLLEINHEPVPFFIEYIEIRNASSAFIKFLDFDSEEQVKELIGNKIYLPSQTSGQKEFHQQDLRIVGFTITDPSLGEIGRVESLITYPNNSVIRVINNKKEILIPVNDEIIKKIDKKKRIIMVSLPDGLLDLNY
jgi:16S rRNA processing protein RimM